MLEDLGTRASRGSSWNPLRFRISTGLRLDAAGRKERDFEMARSIKPGV
jgi:hypothetical protein